MLILFTEILRSANSLRYEICFALRCHAQSKKVKHCQNTLKSLKSCLQNISMKYTERRADSSQENIQLQRNMLSKLSAADDFFMFHSTGHSKFLNEQPLYVIADHGL